MCRVGPSDAVVVLAEVIAGAGELDSPSAAAATTAVDRWQGNNLRLGAIVGRLT